MGIGAADRLTCRSLVLLLADRIGRREDAVIYRVGLSNQAGSLALGPWDKSKNFAHIRSRHWLEKFHYEMTTIILSLMWDLSPDFEVPQAVTKE
jgi:hypothetical protein